MDDLNIENLIRLTEAGDVAQAAEILSEYFQNFPDSEGGAYVAAAAAYTKLMAQNQQELARVLEAQVVELKNIDAAEKAELDAVDLEFTRSQLK